MKDAEKPDKNDEETAQSDSFFSGIEGASSISPNSIEGLFLQALQLETAAQREAYLDQSCGDDKDQRLRIKALLLAYDDAGSFLETPASGNRPGDEISLSFLKPIDKEGCLGTIGPYEVLEVIGRGGMGLVLRAVDLKLNRIVAVKVLIPELAANPNARRRFLREAQAAAAISHPHVVTIHAVDNSHEDSNGKPVPPYLVMECVVGQSLQQKLDRVGTLRLAEILRIGRQIAEGMAAAHKQGVIHRDIKPANILLENGVERVKITDFGLARAIDDITVTRAGEVSGTPQYMSPEQASGERVDHCSDLFSLGCVMYAMCTGHSPFRGDSIAHVIKRVTQDTPRPIAEQNAEIPPWLIQIIDCLLQKNAARRFQSSEGLVAILDQHLVRIQQPTDSGSHSLINQQVPTDFIEGPATPTAKAPTASPSLPIEEQLGLNGKVLVPNWIRSLSRIWLMLGSAIVILLAVFQNLPNVAIGPSEFVVILAIGGMGSIIMAAILSLKAVTREALAIALFIGLGPFGLLLYLVIKDGLQPAPDNDSEAGTSGGRADQSATLQSNTRQRPSSKLPAAFLLMLPATLGILLSVFMQPGRLISDDLATNVFELFKYPMIFAGMWVAQLLINKLHHGDSFPLRSYALASSAVMASMAVGWFWSTAFRMSTPEPQQLLAWRNLMGFSILPTVIWVLFCVYVGREVGTGRLAQKVDGSANQTPAPQTHPANAGQVTVHQSLPSAADRFASEQNLETAATQAPTTAQPQTAGGQVGEDTAQLPLENALHNATQKPLGLILILATFGGALFSLISLPPNLLRNESANQLFSRLGAFATAMMAAWAGQLLVARFRRQILMRNWGLLSSALFGSAALGYFWTTIFRMPVPRESIIGLAIIPTVAWLLYVRFVMQESRANLQFLQQLSSSTETSGIRKWWGPIVVLCICGFVFYPKLTTKLEDGMTTDGVAEFVASRFHTAVTSTVESAPNKAFAEIEKDGKSHLIHVRRKDNGRWELNPDKHATKIEIGKGDTLGPANAEWGGLFIDSIDPGTHVAITGMGPRITGEGPVLLPAGRHKLPVGNYNLMIYDTRSGWMGDIKSNPDGDYQKIYKTVDHVFKQVKLDRPVYDAEAGTYTFAQYSSDPNPIKIEPGEFTTVNTRRNLKRIADGNSVFNKDAATRFMPGQFYRFLWNGEKYSFSADQAKVIDVLLNAYAEKRSALPESEVMTGAFPDDTQRPLSVKAIFNEGNHPSWTEVIESSNNEDSNRLQMVPLADLTATDQPVTLDAVKNSTQHR